MLDARVWRVRCGAWGEKSVWPTVVGGDVCLGILSRPRKYESVRNKVLYLMLLQPGYRLGTYGINSQESGNSMASVRRLHLSSMSLGLVHQVPAQKLAVHILLCTAAVPLLECTLPPTFLQCRTSLNTSVYVCIITVVPASGPTVGTPTDLLP